MNLFHLPCHRIVYLFALIAIKLAPIAQVYPQNNDLRFEHVGLEHGLSQNTINCICQDSIGFLWIGTNDGLNVYDGYDFKVYRVNPDDPRSLSNNLVTAICEDPFDPNTFWIGTYDGGLNKFNRETEAFEHYANTPMPPGLSGNRISSIIVDRTGLVWIGTQSHGLHSYDRKTHEFTQYPAGPGTPQSPSSDSIGVIIESHLGDLWIGTLGGGLNHFDRKTKSFTCYKNDPDNPQSLSDNRIRVAFEDRAGGLWIGTQNGLNCFDPAQQLFRRFRNEPADPASLSHNFVKSIYQDRRGVLWIGTEKGLNLYDRETGQFHRYLNAPDDAFSLSHNVITALYEDRADLIWVGTWGGGLNKYDPYLKKFRHYNTIPNERNSLSFNSVSSFAEDSSGNLWIGTWGGGLNRLDPEKKQFTHYVHEAGNRHGLSDNVVLSLLVDRAGSVWIGTENGGLNVLNRKSGSIKVYRNSPNDPASLSGNSVISIRESRTVPGVLWIATYGSGLNRFVVKEEQFTRFNAASGQLVNDFVRVLYEDARGFLWLGTEDGLTQFDMDKRTSSYFQHQPGNPNSVSTDWVMSIVEDESGNLWLGTYGGGLNKFDPETGRFKRYSKESGLPNDVIYGILTDTHGNLWLSTNRGLAEFDPRSETCRSYHIDNGMQSYEFNARACFKSRDGEMFFGGINGFNAFYPEEVKDNPFIPQIVFTDFKIFNESVSPGMPVHGSSHRAPLTQPISLSNDLKLSYEDNVFSFGFAALHYSAPRRNQFAYIMEGFDKDWIYAGNRNHATYTNLDPGKYKFRVKGSNSDGIWNNEGSAIDIVIAPPFWQTWWFRLTSGLSLLLIAFVWYKQRVRNIENQKRKLEVLVDEKTREIKEREAQLIHSVKMSVLGKLTASIAHEINTPIGTIISNADIQTRCLDKLEGKQSPEFDSEHKKLLRIMRTNSEATLSASSRIAKIVKSLKSFTRMGDVAFDRMDIHEGIESVLTLLHYDIRDGINIVREYGELPEVVCFPSEINQVFMTILQNAHQAIEKKGAITILTTSDKENVYIEIQDTGRGMSGEKLATLFDLNFTTKGPRMGVGLGLPTAYSIIRKHHGQINVETATGEGTKFSIILPRRVDDRMQ